MKIAILGGSFDPPHLGHYLIATQIKELLGMDQVWLMPNVSTSAHHKIFQKELSPVADRLQMTQLMENEYIKASDFELNHNPTSITITTLEKLSKQYPSDTFYWITGSDKLETFNQYDRWKDIINNNNVIVFPREHMLWHLEERVKEAFGLQSIPENVIVLQNESLLLTNISSRIIRERKRKGLSIQYLVPAGIEEYIEKHRLYHE